jgi:phage gp36-like protein
MPYCTQNDLEERISKEDLIALTDDERIGEVISSVVEAEIKRADDRIDGYLRGKFSLPLEPSTIPGILNAISIDIAVYNLYTRKPSVGIPDTISDRFKDTIKQLNDISLGKLNIFDKDSAALAGTSEAYACNKKESDRLFSSDVLGKF